MRRGFGPSAPAPGSSSTTSGPSDGILQDAIASSQPSQQVADFHSQSSSHPVSLSAAQAVPWRLKSPSYLTGKNPYGKILDNHDHPYQKSRLSTSEPPSQLGSGMGGRPRTTGSFRFTTRPTPPPAPKREASLDGPPTPPPLPPRRPPQKLFSVKDAKSFFETKATESRQNILSPPTKAAIARGISIDSKARQQLSQVAVGEIEDSTRQNQTMKKASNTSLHPLSPPTATYKQRKLDQRINPFSRAKTDFAEPRIMVRAATGAGKETVRNKSSQECLSGIEEDLNSQFPYAAETSTSARRKSTNVFTEPKQQAQPLWGVKRSVVQRSRPECDSKNISSVKITAELSEQPLPPDETVRRRSTPKSSTTKTDEVRPSTDYQLVAKMQRPYTGHGIRKSAGQFALETTPNHQPDGFHQSSIIERTSRSTDLLRRDRREQSCSVQTDPEDDANEFTQRSRRRSTMSEPHHLDSNIETHVRNFGEPIQSAEKLEEIAAKSLSHDGSSSHHSFVRRTSTQPMNPAANVGVEEGYYSIEVPDHVDWRGGYGRRKTQDFGFPGARIRPRSTFRSCRVPLQDPEKWTKRACGHFSAISLTESREDAAKKYCDQCQRTPPPLPGSSKHYRSRKQAATDSSVSSSHSSRKKTEYHRRHHSECVSGDKCGDTFAQDLGHIIDSILEEHQNTLQNVINNIRCSQPSLAQLRRVSGDLVKRCKSGASCAEACHNICGRPICDHTFQTCQPICRPCQTYQICQPCESTQSVQQVCE